MEMVQSVIQLSTKASLTSQVTGRENSVRIGVTEIQQAVRELQGGCKGLHWSTRQALHLL